LNPLDKHVLITGGSEGLGLSLGKEWVRSGAKVTLVSRAQAKLDAAKLEVEQQVPGAQVACFAADTTNLDQLKVAVEAATSHFGPVDVLICNAGSSKPGYFIEQPVEDFERTMRVNFFGSLHAAKIVAPQMVARRSGHICLVGSAMSIIGFAGYSSYAPTKWALRGLADCLRNEFQGTGVSVSIAYPPDMDTPGYKTETTTKPQECLAISEGEALMSPDRVAKAIVRGVSRGDYHIPAPDFGQEALASKMAGMTPPPFGTVLSVLLAPLLVLVALVYRVRWDRIVARAAERRRPWVPKL